MAGDSTTDGGLADESMIGVLVIVLVVLLSTGYVYMQQLQAPGGGGGNGAAHGGANARNLGQFPSGSRGGNGQALAPNAVSTVSLTLQQMRLHRSLPSRHGARTITICTDALVQNKESELLAWKSEDVPSVLADLLQIADVYLLCVVCDEKNQAAIERIRAFITSGVAGASSSADGDKTKQQQPPPRGLKAHKILFCTTTIGKIAFVRQIEPQFHVEVDKSAVRELEKHVPRIVHVTPSPQEGAALAGPSAHHVADSFTGYFKLLSALASP